MESKEKNKDNSGIANKKMHYITNARIPTEKAHGVQIMEMCQAFLNNDVDLILWLPIRKNKSKSNLLHSIGSNFKIRKVFSLDLFSIENILGRLAYWIQIVSFYFFIFFIFIFESRKDLIYSRDLLSVVLTFLGYKVVYECHSIPKNRRRLFFNYCKRMCKIIVISNGLKEEFISNGFNPEKILISMDSVNLEKFDIDVSKSSAREKLGLDKDKILIGYTGSFKTMGMDKGLSDIIKSLDKLDENVKFIAVGGSESDIHYYIKLAEEMRVEKRIKLIGHVEQSELAIYQKAFDILLMPFPYNQHYAFYMSPLKMFEYMAGKRPIVASDLPSIRGVLNEDNSFLVKPDNPKDLARGIIKIIKDKQLAEKISQKAFLDVQQYTWDKRAEKIIPFISNC